MTTKTNEYIQKAKDEGILVQRLSLAEKIYDDYGKLKGTKSTGKHKVRFIIDKLVKGKDFKTGQERHEIEYIFEENGEKKSYRKPLRDKEGKVHYFLERMDEFKYGDTLTLEYIPKGLNGYIEVKKVESGDENEYPVADESGKIVDSIEEDQIPVIEEDVMDQDNPLM